MIQEQYQSIHNLSPASEPKIYDKDDETYPNSFNNSSITNYSSFKPSFTSFNTTENAFNSYEDLPSPLSSSPSSSTSSTISLLLPSPPPLPKQNPLPNDLNIYRYEPFSMIIPESKESCKEFTDSNTDSSLKGNILLSPSIFYSSNKIVRTWRYLVTWSILLSLFCHVDPLGTKYTFITPFEYFFIFFAVILLIFRIFIMFAQNNSFKSYVKSYTTSNTNTTAAATITTTTTTTSGDNPTHTETEQPQQNATVLNMERVDTRGTHNENSAGFANSSFFAGCCDYCNNDKCCSISDYNCRSCVNYCIAGCLNSCCLCCKS